MGKNSLNESRDFLREHNRKKSLTGAAAALGAFVVLCMFNHTGYKLPNTGGPGTSLYTLCGCLLIGTALVAGFGRRRRRERRFDR